jgi:hypothetical protein
MWLLNSALRYHIVIDRSAFIKQGSNAVGIVNMP